MTVKVYIIESERGCAQRVDETLTFDTRQQAEQYVAQSTPRCDTRLVYDSSD